MQLNKVKYIYMIGIGGIGMSSIARYFNAQKKDIAGYDKTPTPTTEALQGLNIAIHFEDVVDNIPKEFLNPLQTLVVYTPAIPKHHKQLQYFIDKGFKVYKRAEVLGMITQNTFCLAVAGTHGKTTTSAILSHIMYHCKTGATCFIGGILEGYDSNVILQKNRVTVVEADEYDRSFLHLSPDWACITSMDADHLDVYKTHEALHQSFREFYNRVSKQLIIAKGLPLKGLTYAVEDEADYEIRNVRIENTLQIFDIKTPTEICKNITFNLLGKHNLSNALAAIALADNYGLALSSIAEALQTFKGVQRRFTYRIKTKNVVLIDDYAHHPSEITAVAKTLQMIYTNEKKCVIFQPHLFSRTRDFAEGFAKSLALFDELLLLDIYPARELPIEGIDSKWLLEKILIKNKKLVTREKLLKEVLKSDSKVFVMLGAGDIGLMVEDVQKILEQKV